MTGGRTQLGPWVVLAWSTLAVLVLVFGGLQFASFLRNPDMDVRIYYDAALALRNGENMFAAWNPDSPLTYIYPPLLALIFLPLTYFDPSTAAAAWTVVNVLLLGFIMLVGGREVMRRCDGRLDALTLPLMLLCSFLYFISRVKAELDQGQVDFLVLAFVVLSLVLIRRRPVLAGVLLGVVANIKYQTVIFLPYFLVRGWWRALGGLCAGVLLAAFSGATVLGWELNLDYLRRAFNGVFALFGAGNPDADAPMIFPTDWVESVSLTSTFARWSPALGWGESGLFPMVGVAALACFLIGWWIYRSEGVPLFKGRGGAAGRSDGAHELPVLIEWCGLMVAAIAFAPQTKMRHLAVLMLVVIFMFQLLLVHRPGVPRWPLLVGSALFLAGLMLPLQEGEGGWRSDGGLSLREYWRAQGGPIWCLLLMYFTLVWTGLKWVTHAPRGDRSGGPTPGAPPR